MANKLKQHRNAGKSRSVPSNTLRFKGYTPRNTRHSKYTPHIEDEKRHLKEFNEV